MPEGTARPRHRALELALAVAAIAQIALGLLVRAHPLWLWPHVLFALVAVMPLSLRVALRTLLLPHSAEGEARGQRALAACLVGVLVAQLGLGSLAFAVPEHFSPGARPQELDSLVRDLHFMTGLGLLLLSVLLLLAPRAGTRG